MHWSVFLTRPSRVCYDAQMAKLELPDHWAKEFFVLQLHLQLQFNDLVIAKCQVLTDEETGIPDSPLLALSLATAYYNKQGRDDCYVYDKHVFLCMLCQDNGWDVAGFLTCSACTSQGGVWELPVTRRSVAAARHKSCLYSCPNLAYVCSESHTQKKKDWKVT